MSEPASDSELQPVMCSARGCREPALWAVVWNNPKLHDPDRRKIWTACDQHREHLADFLRLRGFLREVRPLGAERTGLASEGSQGSDRIEGGAG